MHFRRLDLNILGNRLEGDRGVSRHDPSDTQTKKWRKSEVASYKNYLRALSPFLPLPLYRERKLRGAFLYESLIDYRYNCQAHN